MSVPPITINFMLACWTSPVPEKVLREATWNSEAGQRTRQWLTDNGLIGGDNRATERGKAWVLESICAAPLPVPHVVVTTWTIPARQSTVEENWPMPIQNGVSG
jgi:hypothetical protein